jgi:hypothetical protein
MVEVPDLVQNSAITITAQIWYSTSLGVKGVRDLGESVCRCIGRKNPYTVTTKVSQLWWSSASNLRSEHIVGWIHLEDLGNSFVEVHEFLMFLVPRLIASNVKRGCASSMLRELAACSSLGFPGKRVPHLVSPKVLV